MGVTKAIQVDSVWLLERLAAKFPGLLDTETDVSGGDLVDFPTFQLLELDSLRSHLVNKEKTK